MEQVLYHPIGIIHTPYTEPKGAPIQPRFGRGVKGTVEIYDEFTEGLADLHGFSHIILLYHFHKSIGYSLKVVPFLDSTGRGLFATRAPRRPNPIGLSIVQLLGVNNNILTIADMDIVDGTPLLDIKPYVPDFEKNDRFRIGWLEGQIDDSRDENHADDRFGEKP